MLSHENKAPGDTGYLPMPMEKRLTIARVNRQSIISERPFIITLFKLLLWNPTGLRPSPLYQEQE